MGGRGASLGISIKGKKYGTEYKTLFKYGNIKFVAQNEDTSTTAPKETMTKGRVYVTVNEKKGPQYITYYDENGKKSKSIDLLHIHNNMKPHTHHGYEHNENDSKKGAGRLTVKELKMVERVNELWYNYKKNK